MSSSPDSQAIPSVLPLLPLRDVVVFPHMVIPLFVGRPKSIKALETAMETGKSILLVAQKSAAKDDPSEEDLYSVGSIANILQMLKLPDGTVKVLVEGIQRATVSRVMDERSHYSAESLPVAEEQPEGAAGNEVEPHHEARGAVARGLGRGRAGVDRGLRRTAAGQAGHHRGQRLDGIGAPDRCRAETLPNHAHVARGFKPTQQLKDIILLGRRALAQGIV